MTWAIFGAASAALAVLNILLALTAFTDVVEIWPSPKEGSWQSYTFWTLFRGGLGLTILLGIWQFAAAHGYGAETIIGVPLALIGFALTVYGYFDLGLENTYCADEGLVTSGLYRYSRNPQYVASILGFIGLGIAVATFETAALSMLAIGVYGLLPYAEEPWLARAYGDSYEAYKRTTPRFFSLTKLVDRLVPAER
jgi:protein-S-isoprenylcysteine O-methyltransferase Ste14